MVESNTVQAKDSGKDRYLPGIILSVATAVALCLTAMTYAVIFILPVLCSFISDNTAIVTSVMCVAVAMLIVLKVLVILLGGSLIVWFLWNLHEFSK